MLSMPSHLLISPQALWEALAGECDSPPDPARMPGMLAEIQSHIEALMQCHAARGLVGGDVDQDRTLRATYNLLTVLRAALSAEASEEPVRGTRQPGAPLVVLNGEPRRGSPGAQTQVAPRGGSGLWWFAQDEQERPPALTPDDAGGG